MNKAEQSVTAPEYSETNVRVQGVDEADTVKTDGEYIYKISNNQLNVVKAYPAGEMEVVSTLKYDGQKYPLEMYVDDRYLTVILNQYNDQGIVYPADKAMPENKGDSARILPAPFENSVKVLVPTYGSQHLPHQNRD
jgi:uncharacterized secreted protein with C-terminal beta-propeller domain